MLETDIAFGANMGLDFVWWGGGGGDGARGACVIASLSTKLTLRNLRAASKYCWQKKGLVGNNLR